MSLDAYINPLDKSPLVQAAQGLLTQSGQHFPFLVGMAGNPIPDFGQPLALDAEHSSQALYHHAQASAIYDNFLNWLFATFEVNEDDVRSSMVERLNLSPGARVLVTACGLGNDLPYIAEKIGPAGLIYAQDLSAQMVAAAQQRLLEGKFGNEKIRPEQVFFSVGDACTLPFADGYFDAAFHFGGINEFPDLQAAVAEMNRVVRPGGKIAFGDEGVAPWLKNTEYGKMAVCNIPLWASEAPLAKLPVTASKVNLTWLLGNCFYLIDFQVANTLPHINIDVRHQGRRGGSMRTRYYGQLEGVSPELKAQVIAAAQQEGLSVVDWLEKRLSQSL